MPASLRGGYRLHTRRPAKGAEHGKARAVVEQLADPDMRARKAAVAVANITRYMAERPEHFEAAVAGNGKRGAPFLASFNVTPRACGDCGEVAANPAALRWHKKRAHGYNHKVITAEPLAERADVYCMQVEEHHNFALAAGVFVHNCSMADAADLVEIRHTLRQIVNVKGD
jgi:hypothetical protein